MQQDEREVQIREQFNYWRKEVQDRGIFPVLDDAVSRAYLEDVGHLLKVIDRLRGEQSP